MERKLRAPKHAAANDMSESKAIRMAQKGDASAFKRLYMAHSRRVYGLFLSTASNPTEAEDLTRQAFLRLFREIRTHRGEFSLSTRLHQLTRNIVIKQLRTKYAGRSFGVEMPRRHDPATTNKLIS
jgi:DNA-directed RNA polymerase specialized sigma24 family protein